MQFPKTILRVPLLRAVRSITLLALVVLLVADRRWAILAPWGDWGMLLVGALVVLDAALDAKLGDTVLLYSNISRLNDPRGFWFAVILVAALGSGVVVLTSGNLLGLWRIH